MTKPIRSQEPDCRHTNVHDTDAHTETSSKTTHSHGASSVPNQSNTVCSDNNGTQSTSQAQQSEPTDGARATTTQSCIDPGYGMEQMSKLQDDPDYKDTLYLLDKAEQLERGQGLYFIDAEFGGLFGIGKNDGMIDRGNIEAAAKDPCSPGHEAAKMLMENPRLFAAIDANNDGLITKDELHAFIDKMKAQKKSIEDSYALKAKSPSIGIVTGPVIKPTPPPGQGSKPQPPPVTHAPPPPPPSTPVLSSRGGLEGASENINNALSSCEDQMAQLSAQMAATDDPKQQAAIQNKMNALERRMQMLSSMYQEIMTVLSNLSKMQSDIAMTFIRNMK